MHVSNKFWLVESWLLVQCPAAVDTSHSGMIFDQSGYRMSPSAWLVENYSTVLCICHNWTLYPKFTFQPIRTCLTRTQIRGLTIGRVSFRWTCIATAPTFAGSFDHKIFCFNIYKHWVKMLPRGGHSEYKAANIRYKHIWPHCGWMNKDIWKRFLVKLNGYQHHWPKYWISKILSRK